MRFIFVSLCESGTSTGCGDDDISRHASKSETFSASYPALARRIQDYLRWRNANARHPDVLAAQRRERARVRSERQQRWGRPRAA